MNELRAVVIHPDFTEMAAGSVMIECGRTRVLCTASVEEGAPPFLRGKGKGWLTAEYAMLPGSTPVRKARDGIKKDGRGTEIQRLIGRSLRAALNLEALGERTVTIDCDVLQADGGTRTASITGGFCALCLAVDKLIKAGKLFRSPIERQIAAVSVGIVDGEPTLDLEYEKDCRAQTDMNVVMTREADGSMNFVEVQGTGEGRAFSREELAKLLDLAEGGISRLMDKQKGALAERGGVIGKKAKVVLASGNPGKLRELRAMLGDRFELISPAEAGIALDCEETGSTFEENALIKARAAAEASNLPALADDSGLSVDALCGRPGVYSARYSGGNDDDNNRKLLSELENQENRAARYVCVMALALPGGEAYTGHGTCEGEITREAKGRGGFGYDPYFYSTELRMTFAEADPAAKNAVSHRARAVAALLNALPGIL